jgi:hypothetical protein
MVGGINMPTQKKYLELLDDENKATDEYKHMSLRHHKRKFAEMSRDEKKHAKYIKQMMCEDYGGKWKRGRCIKKKV